LSVYVTHEDAARQGEAERVVATHPLQQLDGLAQQRLDVEQLQGTRPDHERQLLLHDVIRR
jgi:hypothetical protein